MAQTKFNSSTAKNLKPEDKVVLHYATNFEPGYPGKLGMRISVKGKKTWFIQYRLVGNSTGMKFSIGQYPALSFKEAKQLASDLLKDISEGGDPKREKQEAMRAVTMSELFDIYYKYHATKNKKASSATQDKANFKKHIKPILGAIKAEDVKRRDVVALLNDIGETGPIMRNRIQSLLSVMFSVGIDQGLLENTPLFRLKKVKEKSRDRVLSHEEIVAIWEQWENVRMGKLLMFKLITAQRDQEVKSMRWDDIKDGVWTIPTTVTKNSKKHEVPLSRQALGLLSTIKHRGDHVFFAARGKTGHVNSTAKCFRECRDAAGLPKDTRGHDLRRTAATGMGDLGIRNSIIAKVLNHSDDSETAKYNRSRQMQEKQRALQKWADKLDRILGKADIDNVVQIRRAG